MFSIEQREFICNTFSKHASWKECRQEFCKKYPASAVPCKTTIYKTVERFRTTGSVLNKKKVRRRYVLTTEKLDEIGAQIETSPTKSLHLLAVQCGVSKASVQRATELLKLRPYKIRAVQQLFPLDWEARSRYCRWFQESVANGILDPELLFFSDEAWFTLKGNVNSLNNIYWCSENPSVVPEVSSHDPKVGVWCAVSARKVIGPVFFEETINSYRYVELILLPFFQELTKEEKLYGFFMQDSTMAHTADFSMAVLEEVFGERLITCGLWPPRSPDLNPCDYYLWGTLKDRVYVNSPHSLQELKENIQREIADVSSAELRHVWRNIFRRCEACLEAGGQQFETLL